MADFTVHPNADRTRAIVRRNGKTAEVYKDGGDWVVVIHGLERIVTRFPACSGHPKGMTPCPSVDRNCLLAYKGRALDDHISAYCHEMHGPRASGAAAAMLGAVVSRTPTASEARHYLTPDNGVKDAPPLSLRERLRQRRIQTKPKE